MAETSESEVAPQTNGIQENELDEDDKSKIRPADIDADMREMERRKRVEMIMGSRLFREELERIIESQMKEGGGPAGLLQQIQDMVGGRVQPGHMFRSANCVVPINDIRGVESMGYAKGEKILRCKLASVYRLMDLYGWTQGIHNHITARLNQDDEHFLVNAYGMLYHEVTASSLVKVDMQGAIVESGTTNFGVNVPSFQLHAAVHAARPDIKCVIHIHTPSVLAVSSLKCGLLPLCQESAVIGEVSQHPYLGTVSEPEEKDKIARNLGPINKVMFLSNHGAVCCGETIEEAFFNVYNTVLACETQVKLMPLGVDNLQLLPDETRKQIYDAARRAPEGINIPASAVTQLPPALEKKEKRWRIGGMEFEALMRMLDNAGFRTGYIYRTPLVRGEPPRPRNDVEVPPAVSSLGYLLEEEEMYKQGNWKKMADGRSRNDRTRWLNSPNVYQKVEILETGTPDPKKITKWVDANADEWVAEGSPTHSSTPVKIESALQFVPKNTNPKEFKRVQKQIKENRRADKITSGPQSHILEGVSWEEAKKLQDANISVTGDQVILVGAASKGIIQREYQHNATVYKTPYAKNPFEAVSEQELEDYKKVITRKQRGESYDEDQSESEALSSSAALPPTGIKSPPSETEDESRTADIVDNVEPRVLRIETKTAPVPSQAEIVLSDDDLPHQHFERSKSERRPHNKVPDNNVNRSSSLERPKSNAKDKGACKSKEEGISVESPQAVVIQQREFPTPSRVRLTTLRAPEDCSRICGKRNCVDKSSQTNLVIFNLDDSDCSDRLIDYSVAVRNPLPPPPITIRSDPLAQVRRCVMEELRKELESRFETDRNNNKNTCFEEETIFHVPNRMVESTNISNGFTTDEDTCSKETKSPENERDQQMSANSSLQSFTGLEYENGESLSDGPLVPVGSSERECPQHSIGEVQDLKGQNRNFVISCTVELKLQDSCMDATLNEFSSCSTFGTADDTLSGNAWENSEPSSEIDEVKSCEEPCETAREKLSEFDDTSSECLFWDDWPVKQSISVSSDTEKRGSDWITCSEKSSSPTYKEYRTDYRTQFCKYFAIKTSTPGEDFRSSERLDDSGVENHSGLSGICDTVIHETILNDNEVTHVNDKIVTGLDNRKAIEIDSLTENTCIARGENMSTDCTGLKNVSNSETGMKGSMILLGSSSENFSAIDGARKEEISSKEDELGHYFRLHKIRSREQINCVHSSHDDSTLKCVSDYKAPGNEILEDCTVVENFEPNVILKQEDSSGCDVKQSSEMVVSNVSSSDIVEEPNCYSNDYEYTGNSDMSEAADQEQMQEEVMKGFGFMDWQVFGERPDFVAVEREQIMDRTMKGNTEGYNLENNETPLNIMSDTHGNVHTRGTIEGQTGLCSCLSKILKLVKKRTDIGSTQNEMKYETSVNGIKNSNDTELEVNLGRNKRKPLVNLEVLKSVGEHVILALEQSQIKYEVPTCNTNERSEHFEAVNSVKQDSNLDCDERCLQEPLEDSELLKSVHEFVAMVLELIQIKYKEPICKTEGYPENVEVVNSVQQDPYLDCDERCLQEPLEDSELLKSVDEFLAMALELIQTKHKVPICKTKECPENVEVINSVQLDPILDCDERCLQEPLEDSELLKSVDEFLAMSLELIQTKYNVPICKTPWFPENVEVVNSVQQDPNLDCDARCLQEPLVDSEMFKSSGDSVGICFPQSEAYYDLSTNNRKISEECSWIENLDVVNTKQEEIDNVKDLAETGLLASGTFKFSGIDSTQNETNYAIPVKTNQEISPGSDLHGSNGILESSSDAEVYLPYCFKTDLHCRSVPRDHRTFFSPPQKGNRGPLVTTVEFILKLIDEIIDNCTKQILDNNSLFKERTGNLNDSSANSSSSGIFYGEVEKKSPDEEVAGGDISLMFGHGVEDSGYEADNDLTIFHSCTQLFAEFTMDYLISGVKKSDIPNRLPNVRKTREVFPNMCGDNPLENRFFGVKNLHEMKSGYPGQSIESIFSPSSMSSLQEFIRLEAECNLDPFGHYRRNYTVPTQNFVCAHSSPSLSETDSACEDLRYLIRGSTTRHRSLPDLALVDKTLSVFNKFDSTLDRVEMHSSSETTDLNTELPLEPFAGRKNHSECNDVRTHCLWEKDTAIREPSFSQISLEICQPRRIVKDSLNRTDGSRVNHIFIKSIHEITRGQISSFVQSSEGYPLLHLKNLQALFGGHLRSITRDPFLYIGLDNKSVEKLGVQLPNIDNTVCGQLMNNSEFLSSSHKRLLRFMMHLVYSTHEPDPITETQRISMEDPSMATGNRSNGKSKFGDGLRKPMLDNLSSDLRLKASDEVFTKEYSCIGSSEIKEGTLLPDCEICDRYTGAITSPKSEVRPSASSESVESQDILESHQGPGFMESKLNVKVSTTQCSAEIRDEGCGSQDQNCNLFMPSCNVFGCSANGLRGDMSSKHSTERISRNVSEVQLRRTGEEVVGAETDFPHSGHIFFNDGEFLSHNIPSYETFCLAFEEAVKCNSSKSWTDTTGDDDSFLAVVTDVPPENSHDESSPSILVSEDEAVTSFSGEVEYCDQAYFARHLYTIEECSSDSSESSVEY